MLHTLIHIYGPFSIHSFGLMIAIGLLITTHLALRHPLRKRIISHPDFINAIVIAISAGFIGSRLLYVIQNWHQLRHWTEVFTVWNGGLSVLGSVIGVLLVIPAYLKRHNIPLLPFLDIIAIHAPLLQSIARLGCFFAGCCFGAATRMPWGITYTDRESFAPLCTALHPTQLYSSLLLFGIFLCMFFIIQKRFKRPGQPLAFYLFLMSLERFSVDFFRGDREFFGLDWMLPLSSHQWISIGIAIVAGLLGLYTIHPSLTKTQRS